MTRPKIILECLPYSISFKEIWINFGFLFLTRMKLKYFLLPFCLLVCHQLFAQNENDIEDQLDQIEHSSHVTIQIDAANKLFYTGRPLGIQGAVSTTEFAYTHHTGLYTYIMPNVWTDKAILKRTLFPDIETGFGFKKDLNDIFYFDVSYSHDFITYGNANFRRAFSNGLSLETETNVRDIVDVGVNFYFLFSKKNKNMSGQQRASDLNIYFSKEIAFYNLLGAKKCMITPMLATNLGSDNLAITRNNTVKETTGIIIPKTVYDKFWGLLDVEISTNFEWRNPHVALNVMPTLITPFNQDMNNRHNQKGHSSFLISGGIKFYLFKKTKA